MATKSQKAKTGPKPNLDDPYIGAVKLTVTMGMKIDEWRRHQDPVPTRSKAVRDMIDLACKVKGISV